MLSDRPLRRHVPTAAGVAALGDDDLLYHHPVSRLWLRLLADRLDGVALLYELAALIADADPEEDPVRALREPSGFHYSAAATLGAVIGQGARERVWQPARYGRGNTPVVKPDSSLAWLVDLAGREAEHPVRRVMPKRLWAWRSSGGARATPPGPGDLANAVVTQLGSAEKRMLDLLAGTSHSTPASGIITARVRGSQCRAGGVMNEARRMVALPIVSMGQCLHRAGHGAFPCTLGSSMPALPAVLTRPVCASHDNCGRSRDVIRLLVARPPRRNDSPVMG